MLLLKSGKFSGHNKFQFSSWNAGIPRYKKYSGCRSAQDQEMLKIEYKNYSVTFSTKWEGEKREKWKIQEEWNERGV